MAENGKPSDHGKRFQTWPRRELPSPALYSTSTSSEKNQLVTWAQILSALMQGHTAQSGGKKRAQHGKGDLDFLPLASMLKASHQHFLSAMLQMINNRSLMQYSIVMLQSHFKYSDSWRLCTYRQSSFTANGLMCIDLHSLISGRTEEIWL